MIIKKIVPCLDVREGKVVKGTKFKNIKEVDDPVVLAEFYSDEGADEIVVYDITASNENKRLTLKLVEDIVEKIKVPLIVGGGINKVEDFEEMLNAGASKISINSSAIKNPKLIKEASDKFGKEKVILSIDAKKNDDGITWNVYTDGGKTDTGKDVLDWVREGILLGAGELVLNSINEDGIKGGYDIDLIKVVASQVKVPIVASGGAGKAEDFLEVLQSGLADSALAASVFHFKEIRIPELKKYLISKGINIKEGN